LVLKVLLYLLGLEFRAWEVLVIWRGNSRMGWGLRRRNGFDEEKRIFIV
jgi:hypothetical protein